MYNNSSKIAIKGLCNTCLKCSTMIAEVVKMIFSQKLQLIRKNKGFTQEELAEKLNVSRQAVAKWESGQVYPDISNLIQISKLFNVTVDYLVKDQECIVSCLSDNETDINRLVEFRLEASVNTYAAYMNETDSTRLDSHDFKYSNGPYTYHDTYVGGEQFAGEEVIWYEGKSQYAMNYAGRVLNQNFSGDFLKEALRQADKKMPFRGPGHYQSGQYIYKCNVVGDFTWFQGYEEIYCDNVKVYECYFHGGIMK